MFDRVISEKGSGGLFGHQAWKFREAACLLLIVTMRRFASGAVQVNKYLPSVCKLVTDKNTKVSYHSSQKYYFSEFSLLTEIYQNFFIFSNNG